MSTQPNHDPRKRQGGEKKRQWLLRRAREVGGGERVSFNTSAVPTLDRATLVEMVASNEKPGIKTQERDGVLEVCLGPTPEKLMPFQVMRIYAMVVECVQRVRVQRLCLHVPKEISARFAAIGVQLALLRGDEFQKGLTYFGLKEIEFVREGADAAFKQEIEIGRTLAACANVQRWLSMMPPNIAHPKAMVRLTRAYFSGIDGVMIHDEPTPEQYDRMGLLNAVAAGNGGKRYVIAVQIDPVSGPTPTHVVYVGKGMCFDTGGYGIKPDGGRGMKGDKTGACSLFGSAAFLASHRELLTQSVIFVFVFTSNMINEEAYVPDSVYEDYNGNFVEVEHPDAEGRMACRDAAAWAIDQFGGEEGELIDQVTFVYTLTGSARVATGTGSSFLHLSEAYRRIPELGTFMQLGMDCGDPMLVSLDMPDAARIVRSPIAGIKNAGNSSAGSQQGFVFCKQAVPEGVDVDTMGIDIAGKAGLAYAGGDGMAEGTCRMAAVFFIVGRHAPKAFGLAA